MRDAMAGSPTAKSAALLAALHALSLEREPRFLVGTRWMNMPVLAIGGNPGDLTAPPITGATGGTFLDPSGNQFNLLAPGSGRLEQIAFTVKAAGWVKLPAGTYTATLVCSLYGVAQAAGGATAWTAGSGNKLGGSTSQSYTQAGTTAVIVPWYVAMEMEGDSTSGLLQGLWRDIVNNVKDTTNNGAIMTNAPTGVNFANEPPLQFAAGVVLGSGAVAGSVSKLTNFLLEAA